MYSNDSITLLKKRIGYSKPLLSEFNLQISAENLEATSGRTLKSFHQLASLENIYCAISEVNLENAKLNDYLSELKSESVLEVVTAILEQNHLYKDSFDYSATIEAKSSLFDDAIGYTMAIKCLELFVSTSRKNFFERNASLSFQTLKIELEGAKNDGGFRVAEGIVYKRHLAIKKAQRIIFPNPILLKGDKVW